MEITWKGANRGRDFVVTVTRRTGVRGEQEGLHVRRLEGLVF